MKKWMIPLLLFMLIGCEESLNEDQRQAVEPDEAIGISASLKEEIASQIDIQTEKLDVHHLYQITDFSINLDDESLPSALKAMPNIKMLQVTVPFEKLSTITNLNRLIYLNIQENETAISDVNFKDFPHLDTLYLSNNRLQHIENIELPKTLHTLWLSDNNIKDLTPLQVLNSLSILSINNNAVSSLLPLKEISNLMVLYASGNQIEDAAMIKNLASLENITLSDNPLRSIEFARELANLKTLLVANTKVSDLSPLARHGSIETLDIRETNITTIKPLLEVKSLNHLILDKEKVKDWQLLEEKNGVFITETLSVEN